MKVLIATDGSEQATLAMRTAARLLRRDDCSIDLLCVAPRMAVKKDKGTGEAVRKIQQDYQARIEEEARKILSLSKVVLSGDGFEAGTRFETGPPANVIIDESASYDMVVVGAHDKYQKSTAGLGPVALRVVAQAASSVLIAREFLHERALRILIATDGSLAAGEAIRLMTDFFAVQMADITLMHVIETPWIHLGLEPDWFDYRGRNFERADANSMLDHEVRVEAEEVIEAARRQLEAASLG